MKSHIQNLNFNDMNPNLNFSEQILPNYIYERINTFKPFENMGVGISIFKENIEKSFEIEYHRIFQFRV